MPEAGKRITLIGIKNKCQLGCLRLVLGLFLLFWQGFVHAIALSDDNPVISIQDSFHFFVASEPVLDSLLAVQQLSAEHWQSNAGSSTNLGRYTDPLWVHFTIDRSSLGWGRDSILSLAYPHHDWVDAYLVEAGQVIAHYQGGDLRDLNARPLPERTHLFPLEPFWNTGGQSLDVYLRLQSEGPMIVPLMLLDQSIADGREFWLHVVYAFYFGALFVMLVYNFFLYLMLRDVAYLAYVSLIVTSAFMQYSVQGFGLLYSWPHLPGLNNTMVIQASVWLEFTAIVFVILYTRLYERGSPLNRWLTYVVAALSVVLVVFSWVLPYGITIRLSHVLGLTATVMGFYVGVQGWRSNQKAARLFAVAWFANLIFIGWYILTLSAVLPSTLIGEHAIMVGSLIELSLFAIAFADRMNEEKEKRLAVQYEMIDTQARMNADLDRKVKERTRDLEVLNQRLETLSITDGLTGTFNRRYFDRRLAEMIGEACVEQETLALLMIDIDHFKQLNDNHGHQFGDECLIRAAELIQLALGNEFAVCARYGGEEFVVILPRVDLAGAVSLGERIRAAFMTTPITQGQIQETMTVSIGVAALAADVEQEAAVEPLGQQLLREADERLYWAKSRGRNQVADMAGVA